MKIDDKEAVQHTDMDECKCMPQKYLKMCNGILLIV